MSVPNVHTPPMFTSVRDLLVKQAHKHTSAAAISWVGPHATIEKTLSFADLERLSFNLARHLRNQGIEGGNCVALIFEPSLDFFIAFLACQILLAIPIVLPSPGAQTTTSDLSLLIPILKDAIPTVILTHSVVNELLRKISNSSKAEDREVAQVFLQQAHQGVICVDVFDETSGGSPMVDEIWEDEDENTLSFIQYTSGVTSQPRGVVVSHLNLMSQLALLNSQMPPHLRHQVVLQTGDRIKLCGSQPHWFNHSLISCYLFSLHQGYTYYVISPETFRREPLVWIETMSQHRIDISIAPNHAFSAVIDAWKQNRQITTSQHNDVVSLDQLDLSHCSQLILIGELAKLQTVEEFFIAFEPKGLKLGSFRAAYSVSENVLTVTMSDNQHVIQRNALSVGGRTPGTKIKIVDPDTLKEVPAGIEGEIWIDSVYSAEGYWRKSKAEVDDVFSAEIAGRRNLKVYLRTGDIGFIEDQRLFVIGRLKETAKIEGKNCRLPDIEQSIKSFQGVVESLALTVPSAAASEPTRLVYLVEVHDVLCKIWTTADGIDYCRRLARRIAVLNKLHAQTVVLVNQNHLPRTHTGSLARGEAERQFLANQLVGVIHRWDTINPLPTSVSKAVVPTTKAQTLDWIKQRAWDAETKRLLWQNTHLPTEFEAFLPEKRNVTLVSESLSENVFLTGSTGVIGTFILAELLQAQSQRSIYCLVRAKSASQGLRRLVTTMKRFGIWKPWWTGRIIPVPGDLRKERFGLSTQEFQSLAEKVTTIIHCGSNSDFSAPYSVHEVLNVNGTKETIRLALSNSRLYPASYHYVSSVAVYDPWNYSETEQLSELEVDYPPIHSPLPGYSQTKWVGEQLVKAASRDFNLPSTIYRLGIHLGHSESGAGFNSHGILMTLLGHFGHSGSAPDFLQEMKLPLASVDFSSKVIASCSLGQSRSHQVSYYHVINFPQYPIGRLMESYKSIANSTTSRLTTGNAGNSNDHAQAKGILSFPPKALTSTTSDESGEQERLAYCLSKEFSTAQLRYRLLRQCQSGPIAKARWSHVQELVTPHSDVADHAVLASLRWGLGQRRAQKSTVPSTSETATSSNQVAIKKTLDMYGHLWILRGTPILAIALSILWMILD